MKKLLLIATAGLIITGLASCKIDYECCYLNQDGTKIGNSGFGCSTSSVTKKEAEDIEAEWSADAAEEYNGSAKCEKI